MKQIPIILLISFASFLLPYEASAYGWRTCNDDKRTWSSNHQTLHASTISFQVGPWRDALNTAVDVFNRNPSNFWFDVQYDIETWRRGNGRNEVLFSDNASYAPAMTLISYDCIDYLIFGTDNEITETDIVFFNGVPYTPNMVATDLWGYGGGSRPFINTAIHELGHAAGLTHENRLYNVMGDDWTHIHVNNNYAQGYVGEDAGQGLSFLYGSWAIEDLSVAHWKYSGADGEYSIHERTAAYDTAGAILPAEVIGGEPGYLVNKGQTIQVEFTNENNGATTHDVRIGYYLSTNSYITTKDQQLKTSPSKMTPDTPYTVKRRVTLPAALAAGVYYLGKIVDDNNRVSETNETDNASYIPIRVP